MVLWSFGVGAATLIDAPGAAQELAGRYLPNDLLKGIAKAALHLHRKRKVCFPRGYALAGCI